MSRDLRAPMGPPWPAYAAWLARWLTAGGAGVSLPGSVAARLSVPAGSVPGMAKSSAGPAFQCAECGWRTTKWSGRCGECQAWGTVEQAAVSRPGRAAGFGAAALAGLGGLDGLGLGPAGLDGTGLDGAGLGGTSLGGAGLGGTSLAGAGLGGPPAALAPASPALPIGEVDATAAGARPTGLDELDRVLGGGLVPGAVVLLAGEPGVGKSTLLLEAGTHAAAAGPVLYITGEESAAQVRLRADRIGAVAGNLYLAAETDLAALLGHVAVVRPRLLIVDSVQTITMDGVDGAPGGVSQIRAVTAALIAVAKQHAVTTVLVGHVTKDGSIAGPRALEHLVDVVLHFEGDRHAQFRMVRALKNRYGPTDEIGCFDLGEQGITELPDPSGLFLTHRRNAVPGTCVTVTLEGRRPLLSEVQTLVAPSTLDIPRRVTSGLDASRVGMVLAVLSRRADLKLGKQDVYAATVGGVRLGEPSVDLAVALALASAVVDLSVPGSVVAVGEVGLAGEVRRVTGVQRRLAEAERMGFRLAIVPAGSAANGPDAKGLPLRACR